MIAVTIRSFEVNIREETLMIGESSSAECDLLNAVGDSHVKNALGSALDVVGHHDVVLQVPYFQVISASSEEEVRLVEDNATDGHCFALCAAYELVALDVVDPC